MSPNARLIVLAFACVAGLANAQNGGHQQDNTPWPVNASSHDVEELNLPVDQVDHRKCDSHQKVRVAFDANGDLGIECTGKNGPQRLSGVELVSARFFARSFPAEYQFEIQQAQKREQRWVYKVMYSHPNTAAKRVALCRANPDGWALAAPRKITDGTVEWKREPSAFRFSCLPSAAPPKDGALSGGGAIAKCVERGYGPPASPSGANDPALARYQACLAMTRADYCGDGQANTFGGTPFAFVDLDEVSAVPAAWCPKGVSEGASCFPLAAIWGKNRVLCMSQRRWESLSVSGSCLDSRLPECDSKPIEAWRADGAVFASYAVFHDRMLVGFQKKQPARYLATTAVKRVDGARGRYVPDCQGRPDLDCDGWTPNALGPVKDSAIRGNELALIRYVRADGTSVTATEAGYGALERWSPQSPIQSRELQGYLPPTEEGPRGQVACAEGHRPLLLMMDAEGRAYTTVAQRTTARKLVAVLGCIQSMAGPATPRSRSSFGAVGRQGVEGRRR